MKPGNCHLLMHGGSWSKNSPDDSRKALVVLIENLDTTFKNIGKEGQHELRAFLQESRALCLVATSQQLSADVKSRESPFFGFFDIQHLMPLGEDDTIDLLTRVAEIHGETDLVSFLKTREGRNRVKVVLHLAGGNHRVFIILAEFLNRRSLDELVPPFERLLDELTPYYQARIAWLSPQQRKIAEFLCRSPRPVPVKEIARMLFQTHQVTFAQLKELRSLGYVISEQRGREVLYELAEPLMRLCWEVKESRGEPIRLIVEFLRAWFDRDERQTLLLGCQGEAEVFRPYLEQSLIEPQVAMGNPMASGIAREHLPTVQNRQTPEGLGAGKLFGKDLGIGAESGVAGQFSETVADLQVIDQPGATAEEVVRALIQRGIAHLQAGRAEAAVEDFTRAIELPGAPAELVGPVLVVRSTFHARAGRAEEAVEDFTRAIELPGARPNWSPKPWSTAGSPMARRAGPRRRSRTSPSPWSCPAPCRTGRRGVEFLGMALSPSW